MTNYSRGRSFEYSTVSRLEKAGHVCIRAAGSKGPADVVAAKGGKILFVQCKIDGRICPAEWNDFMDFCDKAGALPLMARRPKSGRGVEFFLLKDRKDGKKRPQPMAPVDINVL